MPINFRNKYAIFYKKEISEQFKFLKDYFNFEPGDIFIEILPLEEFNSFYRFKKGVEPLPFIVGSALDNGEIIILDKKDFNKKYKHHPDEFKSVIIHELSHIFIRRITWPKQAFIWIQEGLCEYLSFGIKKNFHIKNFIDFHILEEENGWNRYQPYQQAGAFFKFLSYTYGKEKVIKLIKMIKFSSKNQYSLFKKIFLIDFDKLQKNFIYSYSNEKFL
jgi:hypothetical protein